MPPLPWFPGDEAQFPRWIETLRDRTQVLVRPMHASDREAEARFIAALSPRARRFRFLGHVGPPGDALLDRLTHPDPASEAAFVALAPDGAGDRIIGVSRYASDADGTRCECAVAVADAWQDRGLGMALMRHLVEVARGRGIATLYCIEDRGNTRMADLALRLGFRARFDPAEPTRVVHELHL